jgi:RNA recognition motif-containing protein
LGKAIYFRTKGIDNTNELCTFVVSIVIFIRRELSKMAPKSAAQLRRLHERAAARGETYTLTASTSTTPDLGDVGNQQGNKESSSSIAPPSRHNGSSPQTTGTTTRTDGVRRQTAVQLRQALDAIEQRTDTTAKDRRSAKRKAEAIAAEAAGCTATELLAWYEQHGANDPDAAASKIPNIVFVGQLSYDTTKDSLFQHIRKEIGTEHKVNPSTVKIRLLTDAKTKKSRGMAFVEVPDPEMLYACLKLHHTFLEGRRLNVERTAGGRKSSDQRKTKIQQRRQEQEQYFGTVVDNMLQEHYKSGEIKPHEIDDGVVGLCKRHSATVVQAALEKYVESNGRDMDNPSAYLTFLLGKLAEEGIFEKKDETNDKGRPPKRPRPEKRKTASNRAIEKTSEFIEAGVDMSISEKKRGDLNKIFPSMRRGRGRGYM